MSMNLLIIVDLKVKNLFKYDVYSLLFLENFAYSMIKAVK